MEKSRTHGLSAKSGDESTDGVEVAADEAQLLADRRAAIRGTTELPAGNCGLALSGGGIRSATFSLGVLQAIAEARAWRPASASDETLAGNEFRASLLSQFDYLSTVSGGGYIGAFLCSLFQPGRLRPESASPFAAADDAVRTLSGGPPGRIHASDTFTGADKLKAPLAWLRENGRYLIPTGVGDAVYAAALGIRGWIALHFVIGTVLIALLSVVALARYGLPVPMLTDWEQATLAAALSGTTFVQSIWWSSLFPIAVLPLLLWALPAGVGYWLSFQTKDGHSAPLNVPVFGMLAGAAVLVLMAWMEPGSAFGPIDLHAAWLPMSKWAVRQILWMALAAIAFLGVVFYMAIALWFKLAVEQRVAMTHLLSNALITIGALLLVGTVETIGQTLYLKLTEEGAGYGPVLTPAALVTGLVWLVKTGAGYLTKTTKSNLLAKIPLTTLGGAAGIVIFVLVASLWELAVAALVWMGERPDATNFADPSHVQFLWILAVAILLLATIVGQFPSFINLSSLQSFYSARLTRAYLGASNGERFTGDANRLTVAEPLPKDNLMLKDFFEPRQGIKAARLTTVAPLHIINVTLNKTVDPAEQLVQRDRKGQPLAVLPFGFSVDGVMTPFVERKSASEIYSVLGVGQWIGTSGAAFSTGIGRETTLGMSLLMGIANVRLGIWWGSGYGTRTTPYGLRWVTAGIGAVFRTQTYLSYEFRARFFGMHRQWQYLSDGGHFENTGIYELLRGERRLGLIVASDNGADPTYAFADLANLIRLARIDLRVDISVVSDFAGWPRLINVFGKPDDFLDRPAKSEAPATEGRRKPFAILLKATQSDSGAVTWIVLLKPANHDSATADVRQYATGHPSFPQEPTTDQFFDEAQWESYRALGYLTASQVLKTEVFGDVLRYVKSDGKPDPKATDPDASGL